MKKTIVRLIPIFLSAALVLNAQTNDLFDNSPTVPLKHNESIQVTGEVELESAVILAALPLRSVAVKETALDGKNVVFKGAYRYDGYSLADILDRIVVKKKTAKEYPRIIDLYIEVSNDAGEKAIFSWGEIYYPNNKHRIILATAVARLVPSLNKDLWPLPEENKLVSGSDFITVRNIRNPTRITVKSFDIGYLSPNGATSAADKMRLRVNGTVTAEYAGLPDRNGSTTYRSIFYGQGKGFLSSTPFTGIPLSDILFDKYPSSTEALREGLAVIVAADGYRAVYALSEIVNRNDHQEILLMDKDDAAGIKQFSIFPSCDFFSDRAVGRIVDIDLRIPAWSF